MKKLSMFDTLQWIFVVIIIIIIIGLCGVIQSEITTEQVSGTGKKRVSTKTTG